LALLAVGAAHQKMQLQHIILEALAAHPVSLQAAQVELLAEH
jgi:hypothetical protein